MKKQQLIWSFILLFCLASAKAQTDSSFLKKYPYLIGNLSFAVDSLQTPIGKITQGTDTSFQVALYNAGKRAIGLKAGKSNKFVDITYSGSSIAPKSEAIATIHIHVMKELPPGEMQFEAAFETDDKQNPYKFLYFSATIIKITTPSETAIFDTVPRLIFDNYLYDFGHLRRGKNFYYTFNFSNRGTMDLYISKMVVDKGLTIMEWPAKIIPSGASGSLTVKIKGRRYVGVLHKTITIYSNDPVNPVLTLGIHGTIKINPTKNNPTDYCIGE